MKQVIVIKRVEIKEIELEVCQPLAKGTLRSFMNGELAGLATPTVKATSHSLGAWEVVKAAPQGEIIEPTGKIKKKGR
jgi:hypothetical protein